MFEDILKAVKNKLDEITDIKNTDFYEGQLEDIENFLIDPPHAFIELETVTNSGENYIEIVEKINIFLCTSHLIGTGVNDLGMFTVIEEIIDKLHNKYIYDSEDNPIDKLFFSEMNRLGIFPGLAIYSVTFNLGAIYG